MDTETPTYHRRVAEEKRTAILDAATRLFVQDGYGGTSLAKVAAEAGVSTATLFKQFPTKDSLFEAIVVLFWADAPGPATVPPPPDARTALRALGQRYAALLTRPGMAGLHRMVISEAPRFPELARIQFDLGKEPFFDEVRAFLVSADAARALQVKDPAVAATQFLGMISNFVLWPKMLLVEWATSAEEAVEIVEQAVETLLARHGVAGTTRDHRKSADPHSVLEGTDR